MSPDRYTEHFDIVQLSPFDTSLACRAIDRLVRACVRVCCKPLWYMDTVTTASEL